MNKTGLLAFVWCLVFAVSFTATCLHPEVAAAAESATLVPVQAGLSCRRTPLTRLLSCKRLLDLSDSFISPNRFPRL